MTTQTPTSSSPTRPSRRGDPTWELGEGAPLQGDWTEAEYIGLGEEFRAELNSGCLEFLPMPTWIHAWIVDYFHDLLKAYVRPRKLGYTASSQVRVRTNPGQVREPDIVYLTPDRIADPRQPSDGADLIVEVVREGHGDRVRDYDEKRAEYAQAGIPEYWIVDPATETITVLALPFGTAEYVMSGEYKSGQTAVSVLLPGFAVDVSACFAAGKLEGG